MIDGDRLLPDPLDPAERFEDGPDTLPFIPQAPGKQISADWGSMSRGRGLPERIDPHPLDITAQMRDHEEQQRWNVAADNISRLLGRSR